MSSGRKSVLLIDNDQELLQILASFISVIGWKVARSSSIREGLYKLGNQKFDIIFIDPVKNDLNYFIRSFLEIKFRGKAPGLCFMTRDLEIKVPDEKLAVQPIVLPKPFNIEEFWTALSFY
jgi:DNA-binding response OmpR family regulator